MTLPTITDPHRQNIGCTRLSTAEQQEGYGQPAQEADIRNFARKHSLPLTAIMHEVISGTTVLEQRSVIQDYYRLARRNPGLGFIFPRADRLGRLAERIITIARDLCDLKARVYVVGFDKPLDPKDNEWLMFQVKAIFAEQAFVNLVDTMDKGRVQKAERGLWAHGSSPYGYDLVRDSRGRSLNLTPSPTEAPGVKRLFEVVMQHGKVKAAQVMRDEGWPAPTTAGWSHSSVEKLVRNRRYLGTATFRGIPIVYPALITREQFNAAQAAVAERKNNHSPPRQRDYLLTGLARCGSCGSAMTVMNVRTYRAKKDGTDEHYRYYRCWNAAYGTKGEQKCQHRKNYPAAKLEADAWAAFSQVFASPEALGLFYAAPKVEMPDHTARVDYLKGQMAEAFSRAVSVGIPDDVLTLTLKPMRDELARLEEEMRELPQPEVPDLDRLAHEWRTRLSGPMNAEEKRYVLDATQARFAVSPESVTVLSLSLPH